MAYHLERGDANGENYHVVMWMLKHPLHDPMRGSVIIGKSVQVSMVITRKHVSAGRNLLCDWESYLMLILLFSGGRMSYPVQKQHRSLNSVPATNVEVKNKSL